MGYGEGYFSFMDKDIPNFNDCSKEMEECQPGFVRCPEPCDCFRIGKIGSRPPYMAQIRFYYRRSWRFSMTLTEFESVIGPNVGSAVHPP